MKRVVIRAIKKDERKREMRTRTIAKYLMALLCLVGVSLTTTFGQTFDLDGVTFESTPTIITRDMVAATANPGQPIDAALFADVYFRTATGQFILGLGSGSYDEVVFFDSPATGSGFTVNTGGSIIYYVTGSLSEGPDDSLISALLNDECNVTTNLFPLEDFTADFTASASTRIYEVERRKLDIDTSLLFASTDGSAYGGGYADGGISVFKLSDSAPGTGPMFDTATRGTNIVIAGGDSTYSGALPPGIAISPSGNVVYGKGNGKPSTNVVVYSYSGLDSSSGDYGSENGVFAEEESFSDFNAHVGLTGTNKLGSVSAIAYGANDEGQVILSIVDQNGTSADGSDDRIFFFVQQASPPMGTVIVIE